ncbi:uncharacterized protein LOC141554302 isoform X4 [Sminthopsis crassicaudata]|uniref:uncharacterized protein LOC141554302 isoform X4 n=1 Tax=Sminthopsis crassicaudata TaxID=9301 RepID=UPI003D6937D9
MIKIKGDLQATKEEIRIATNSCKQQLQAEFVCCNQARQIQLHQLKEKLLTLQQELEIRTEELQSSYCSLLQYQSILDKQSCDLEMLHQHCQMKEDEVTIYEEVMEKNKEDNVRLQEKLQISQEQLALAENRITSLESSLNLYKDKYQAAVNSLELLECQMKSLEGDVKIISTQGEDGKKDQPKERTTECLLYELKETQKRLHDALKNGTEQEEVLQELRHKLICSNLKILAHLEEQCEYQCLRVEEHQYLLRDMKKELERVSEQKKKITKDLMKLELDMHNLLQETATQTERKNGEMKDLKEHIKNLEGQLKESQTLCLEKEKVIQEKDEDLCQKKQEIIEMQNNLEEKDSDLEKQKAKVDEAEDALQVLKEKEEKCETQNAALDAKIQQLQCNLNETHQGQLIMAQQLTCVEKKASMLKDNLDLSQQKLEDQIDENMEKNALIKKLSCELKRQQEDKSTVVNLLEAERKNTEMLMSELEICNKKYHDAEKKNIELQKTTCDIKLQLSENQDQTEELKDQLEEEHKINRCVRKQVKQLECEREDSQDLKLKWKTREKELKNKIESLKKEIEDNKKLALEKLNILEEENRNLVDQQKCLLLQSGTESKLENVVMRNLSEEYDEKWKEPWEEDDSCRKKSQYHPLPMESPPRKLSVAEKMYAQEVSSPKSSRMVGKGNSFEWSFGDPSTHCLKGITIQ